MKTVKKKSSQTALAVVLQLIGAKWKIVIIRELLQKNMRFAELKKQLGCTSKVLISCLKEMEADGLVLRKEIKTTQLKVEYSLTDLGCTLQPIIESMESWGKDYKKWKALVEKRGK